MSEHTGFDPKDIDVVMYRPSYHGSNTWLPANGVTVMHLPTSIGVTVDSERSQHANKERALKLLERLLRVEFPYMCTETPLYGEDTPPLPQWFPGKVQMIKNVRNRAGCGLKEAKEAVDLHNDEDLAVLHIIGKIKDTQGYCRMGEHCLCGGDVPAVRVGCFEWKAMG